MKAIVNGQTVEWSSISYRELGFGQALTEADRGTRYSLVFSYAELAYAFQGTFDTFVVEMRTDDEATGESCAGSLAALAQYEYPTYCKLMEADKAAFGNLIRDVLALEFLEAVLPQHPVPKVEFVINSIEEVKMLDLCVEIRGLCYRRPGYSEITGTEAKY